MSKTILAESNPVVKHQYKKPAISKGAINPPLPAGYYLEVARVTDVKSGGSYGVVSTPAGLFCECRPLMEYLTSAPCVHMVAVLTLAGGEFQPLPL